MNINNVQKMRCLNDRLKMKDLSIFDLKDGFYAKKTTSTDDLQTPGIEGGI